MPETFRCDECGKTFPTEGDVMQHTQSMHGSSGMGGYQQSDAEEKNKTKDEPDIPTAPFSPRNG
jgi:hypothetical protein